MTSHSEDLCQTCEACLSVRLSAEQFDSMQSPIGSHRREKAPDTLADDNQGSRLCTARLLPSPMPVLLVLWGLF